MQTMKGKCFSAENLLISIEIYCNYSGFSPSHRYYESNLPSSLDSFRFNTSQKADSKISKDDRLRFGIPVSTNYGNTANGVQYGTNGVGYVVSPMKIDIGGIALGALIGLGAILVVPKIAQAFAGGYGYRSKLLWREWAGFPSITILGLENDMTNVLARIDNSLEQHNIDSSTCMQRIICTYVNDAQKNIKNGEANTIDQFVMELSKYKAIPNEK